MTLGPGRNAEGKVESTSTFRGPQRRLLAQNQTDFAAVLHVLDESDGEWEDN